MDSTASSSFHSRDLQHVSAGHQGAEEAGGISTSSELQPPQVHLQVKHSLQLQLGINKTANINIFFRFFFFPFLPGSLMKSSPIQE